MKSTDNIYNACVVGFCDGVKQALAEQSKALMVVLPEDVKTAYEERSKGFKVSRISSVNAYRSNAYNTGKEHGYNAMKRNALEG